LEVEVGQDRSVVVRGVACGWVPMEGMSSGTVAAS
jgi:hypothetical protein